jgi:hypothetical protein
MAWTLLQAKMPRHAALVGILQCCLLWVLRLLRWTPSNRSPRPGRPRRNRLASARLELAGRTILPLLPEGRRRPPATAAERRYRLTTSARCSQPKASRQVLVPAERVQIRCHCRQRRPAARLRPTARSISSSSASLRRLCFRRRRFPSTRRIIQNGHATPATRQQRAGRSQRGRHGLSHAS